MPKGNLSTFPRYRLSSAPSLGAQTYIRCYQYRQSLDYVQKYFVLLALRKTEDLGSWRLNSLRSKVDRTVAARTLGWGHEVGEGTGLSTSKGGGKICHLWTLESQKKIRGFEPLDLSLT